MKNDEASESSGCSSQTVQQELVIAAGRGQIGIVKKLIASGADINGSAVIDEQEVTAMEAVITSNTIETDSSDVDEEDDDEQIEEKRFEVLEFLLGHGGDPNTRVADGRPLLHLANGACITLLAKAGTDLEATDVSGRTALLGKTAGNDVDAVSRLLFRGASPNVFSADGTPVLMLTFLENGELFPDIVKWYIAYGVDLEATDASGQNFEQQCEKIAYEHSLYDDEEPDEFVQRQASEIFDLLQDQDSLERFHGSLVKDPGSEEDFWKSLSCALDFLDDIDVAYSLVHDRVSEFADEAIGLLEKLFQSDDCRYRYVAALNLGEAKVPVTKLRPLLSNGLADSDEDVREAVEQAIAERGEAVGDLSP